MQIKSVLEVLAVVILALVPATASAQQLPNPYGAPVSLADAKKAAAAAIAEAQKNKWTVAVAIVDPSGNLIYYEKLDNTQIGSAKVAVEKAKSSAIFKRPTKAFEDALAAGGDGLRTLGLDGAVPLEGGFPLIMDGKIVGGIGVSGAKSSEDAVCAKAGADTLK
jgi:uncharacterized protein GlcG (DUF336 family)